MLLIAEKVLYHYRGHQLKGTLVDNQLRRMEQYAENLEQLLTERNNKYMEEKKRAEDMVHRMVPK